MKPILFTLGTHPLTVPLCETLVLEQGKLDQRRFPDGESYLRVESDVNGRQCLVLVSLAWPDENFLPLAFLSDTLRELGATSVGLVAPYLCYMRQDCRFMDGEAITSRTFAGLVSDKFDWLVTVDPHLHRYQSLNEIYRIPNQVVQAAPELANWLGSKSQILLVGPDAESEQWVAQIAGQSGHPFVIGEKERRGDRDVVVSLPDLSCYQDYTAVIIDDVIASGHTLLQCMEALQQHGIQQIECAAVHGIFADKIDRQLVENGLQQLVTTNSIPHRSNQIDLSELLCDPIRQCILKGVVRA